MVISFTQYGTAFVQYVNLCSLSQYRCLLFLSTSVSMPCLSTFIIASYFILCLSVSAVLSFFFSSLTTTTTTNFRNILSVCLDRSNKKVIWCTARATGWSPTKKGPGSQQCVIYTLRNGHKTSSYLTYNEFILYAKGVTAGVTPSAENASVRPFFRTHNGRKIGEEKFGDPFLYRGPYAGPKRSA